MPKQTLQQELQEINNSTLHNMQFLLESHSNELLEVIDRQSTKQIEVKEDVLNIIRQEISSVIRTLQGIETVINHNIYITKASS